jgi:hypothetical protein
MGCCGSTSEPDKLLNPDTYRSAATFRSDGSLPEEWKQMLSSGDERAITIRHNHHLVTIEFEHLPLGLKLTSDVNGKDAYVTKIKESNNEDLTNSNLALKSKLLKVDGTNIEGEFIDHITATIQQKTENLPFTLTFCLPGGLDSDERPDPSPDRVLPSSS